LLLFLADLVNSHVREGSGKRRLPVYILRRQRQHTVDSESDSSFARLELESKQAALSVSASLTHAGGSGTEAQGTVLLQQAESILEKADRRAR